MEVDALGDAASAPGQNVSVVPPPAPDPAECGAKRCGGGQVEAKRDDGSRVRVAVRVRPLTNGEKEDGCSDCLTALEEDNTVLVGTDHTFAFDEVFGPTSRQQAVYTRVVQPLLARFQQGYNCSLMAYGQTASGKTFTMGTADGSTADSAGWGVIPRVAEALFSQVTSDAKTEYEVSCTFVEIHNEQLRDLLRPSDNGAAPGARRGHGRSGRDRPSAADGSASGSGSGSGAGAGAATTTVSIMETTDGELQLAGATVVTVGSAADLQACLANGSRRRATGATGMNAHSSRSHAVFTIYMEQSPLDSAAVDADGDVGMAGKRSKFHLVDLAGSERAKKTGAQGATLREGSMINRGLLALGNVINALTRAGNKSGFVPYRDSKLTRMLQDSLGGNSNTAVIACVSPADFNLEESVNTLRYAQRAKKITNHARINVDPTAATIAQLRRQVVELRKQVLHLQAGRGAGSTNGPGVSELAAAAGITSTATDEALYQALHQVSVKDAECQRLRTELAKAEERASRMARDCEALCEQLVDAELSLEQTDGAADAGADGTKPTSGTRDHLKRIHELEARVRELEPRSASGGAVPAMSKEEEEQGASLRAALATVGEQLATKQKLLERMTKTGTGFVKLQADHTAKLRRMEQRLQQLSAEKARMAAKLKQASAGSSASGGAGASIQHRMRTRIKELETSITSLKKQQQRLARMSALKDKAEGQAKRLAGEVTELKVARVNLMKQMKKSAAANRKEMADKRKEVAALRKQNRVKSVKLNRLTESKARQQNVLRQKLEKANSELSRLKNRKRGRPGSARDARSGGGSGASSSSGGGGSGAGTVSAVWESASGGAGQAKLRLESLLLNRVATSGSKVPRMLAGALQEEADRRWKLDRLEKLLVEQVAARKAHARKLAAAKAATTNAPHVAAPGSGSGSGAGAGAGAAAGMEPAAAAREALVQQHESAVAIATSRIAAIQELQMRLKRKPANSLQPGATWSALVRDEKVGRHAISWLLRCLARMAGAQLDAASAKARVVELESECSMLKRTVESQERRFNVEAAKAQIEHEEKLLLLLEHSMQATGPPTSGSTDAAAPAASGASAPRAEDVVTAADSSMDVMEAMPSIDELAAQLQATADRVQAVEELEKRLDEAVNESEKWKLAAHKAEVVSAHSAVVHVVADSSTGKPKPKSKPKAKKAAESEYETDTDWLDSSSDDDVANDDSDSDWHESPVRRRRPAKRSSTGSRGSTSSRSAATVEKDTGADVPSVVTVTAAEKKEGSTSLPSDLASEIDAAFSSTPAGCKCGGKCIRGCPCKKGGSSCSDGCGCSTSKCTNRAKVDETAAAAPTAAPQKAATVNAAPPTRASVPAAPVDASSEARKLLNGMRAGKKAKAGAPRHALGNLNTNSASEDAAEVPGPAKRRRIDTRPPASTAGIATNSKPLVAATLHTGIPIALDDVDVDMHHGGIPGGKGKVRANEKVRKSKKKKRALMRMPAGARALR